MNITTLHAEARAALSGEPDKYELRRLANMAGYIAEMVGWAPGVIDQDGRVKRAFGELMAVARQRFQAEQSPDVATLHDALADLIDAIARHDRDLTPTGHEDEDTVDL